MLASKSVQEIIAKETAALTKVPKNGFHKCFQKFYKQWQKCVTAQGNLL
jgi:hypothetical protein